LPRGRHRQSVPLGERLKARFVVGDHKPERFRQALAEARNQQDLCILLVKQYRRLGLRFAKADQRIDQSIDVLRIVVPR
jgi:hypothetical protein